MNILQTLEEVKKSVQSIIASIKPVDAIIAAIGQAGGIAYLVGGSVRDAFLNLPIKDLDIEIHNLSMQQLEDLLSQFGYVNVVGKSFGVLKLERLPVDWSLPRTDTKGRKPQVTIDPWLDSKHAFERRDLTMNAMGLNLHTYELIDPFDGLHDLQMGYLRTPNPQFFLEDPLRFYRVMQFVGRFGFTPDRVLSKLCSIMDISHVSRERIEEEFRKLFLYSQRPSLAFIWLDSIGRLDDVAPELAATKGMLQEPDWHPEGDVFEHTLQTIDAAAQYDYVSHHEKLLIMYACLCHDLGKVATTKLIKGRLTAHDHAQQGVYYATKLLKRITHTSFLVDGVKKLVKTHLYPFEFITGNAGLGAYKRLALFLAPEVSITMLAKVACADKQARNSNRHKPLNTTQPIVDTFLEHAERAGVLHTVEAPLLQGRDLMPEIEPGPRMGVLVKKAYALQLSEGIKDKEILKRLVLKDE
jgi:tRNA nucleotidyltransferase (CCA-adding enzyme)